MDEERKLTRLEKGKDLSRILAFTDGVFAIAITLLVLQIDVPTAASSSSDLWQKLVDESGDLVAYGFSFIVIGFYWTNHHRLMRQVAGFDRRLMMINIAYLGMVVLLPFTSQLLGEYGNYWVSVALYAINLSLIALAAWWTQSHILKGGLAVKGYEWDLRLSRKSELFNSVGFLLAIPLAYFIGAWALLLWFGLRWDPFQRRREAVYDRNEA